MVKISLSISDQVIESNFDGKFELEFPNDIAKTDLVFDLGDMTVKIQNFKLDENRKIDLGKITLPGFKNVGIEEYNKLSENDKNNCKPIYHYAQLLGYLNTNKLENKYLTLNCNEGITEFEYNSFQKTVSVDWEKIKNCK